MSIEIKVLTKEFYTKYEEFILSYDTSLFYHSTKYKDFLEDLLKCKSKYLLAYENGKIKSVLPLMIKDGPYGKVVNSLPYYGSHGGIIGARDLNIVSELKAFVDDLDYSSLTLTSSPFNNTIEPIFSDVTDRRYSQITHFINNSDSEDYLLTLIDSSAKRNIKKAIKEGITVSTDNLDAVDFIKKTHVENMAVIGGNAKSYDFFEKFPKYFEENKNYKINVAYHNNNPVAALLTFYYNKTVEYFTPVIKEQYRNKQPLALILFETMKDAIMDGYQFWNWGGTWLTQSGVYQFKKKWGATERIYNYSTHIRNDDICKVDPEEIKKHYEGFYAYNFNKVQVA